jgi:hypothetical protein
MKLVGLSKLTAQTHPDVNRKYESKIVAATRPLLVILPLEENGSRTTATI